MIDVLKEVMPILELMIMKKLLSQAIYVVNVKMVIMYLKLDVYKMVCIGMVKKKLILMEQKDLKDSLIVIKLMMIRVNVLSVEKN